VITLYLVTGLIYPEFAPDRQVDLRAHYFQQRRHFFSFCIDLLLVSIGRNLIVDHALPAPSNLAFHLVFIGFALSGILSAREWYHKVAVMIVSATFVLYVVTLFTRLK
jgi:uncharacterized membrane protein